MQVDFFTIPVFDNHDEIKALNSFLGSKKIIDIDKQFVNQGIHSFWSICVRYTNGLAPNTHPSKKAKTDYKAGLSEEEFKLFSTLRKIRIKIAEEEAVPAYAVFTDEELAKLARNGEINRQTLASVEGIGEKKIEKYGHKVVDLLKTMQQ